MSKCLAVFVVVAVAIFSSAAAVHAGTSESVNVLVTIEKTLSITIAGGPVDFGTMRVRQIAVSANPVTVKNDGSGSGETVTLSVANPTGWTQGVPAAEVYRMSFQFSAVKPLADDVNWKAPSAILEPVAYDVTKNLWVKMETPTSTGYTTQRTIPVTITAQ